VGITFRPYRSTQISHVCNMCFSYATL
jgi:hypothetical protein